MSQLYLENSELVSTDGITKSNIVTTKISALTAATTLTTAQSNFLFTLGTAGGFSITLPTVASSAGVYYEFVVKVAPTTAYTIVTASSENKIYGLVVTNAYAAGSPNAVNTPADATSGTASDRISLVANKSLIGDRVTLLCDGTYWYAMAYSQAYDGITFDVVS